MTKTSLLVGDIGGTNARFAVARNDAPGFDNALTLSCTDYPTAEAAISDYLGRTVAKPPDVICLAAAGPVVDQQVRFTNNNWTLAADDLSAKFKTGKVRLLNDFEAIACSIPFLGTDDCAAVGPLPAANLANRDFTIGIIGPGTGLGAAGLLQRDGKLIPIVGEGGHVGFAPESPLQIQLLGRLRERYERVSDERLVSGQGLENIYAAVREIHGEELSEITAKEIFARAAADGDVHAVTTLQVFYEILGQVAGNLALTLGAIDGVYIAGGIVKRDTSLLVGSRFREAFDSKGSHRSLMERIPTTVITHPEPGLLGASYLALRMSG